MMKVLLAALTVAGAAAIVTPAAAECGRCENGNTHGRGHRGGGALIDVDANVGDRRGLVDVDANVGGRRGLLNADVNVGGRHGLLNADVNVGGRGGLLNTQIGVGQNRRNGGLIDLDVRALSGGVGH